MSISPEMKRLFRNEIKARMEHYKNYPGIITMLEMQLECNKNDQHVFEDMTKDSRFGGRFEERCINCGFTNFV